MMEMFIPILVKEEEQVALSPSSESSWPFEDDVAEHAPYILGLPDSEPDKPLHPLSRAEVAKKLLQDLDEWIKEEPFSDWLEEKIDLPVFEELPGDNQLSDVQGGDILAPAQAKPVEIKSVAALPQDTQTLLQEFETVFGEVEMTHGALTPPESPTVPIVPSFPDYMDKPVCNGELVMLMGMVPTPPVAPLYANSLAHEMAVVDELVRTRVEALVPEQQHVALEITVVNPWGELSSASSSSYVSDMESDSSQLTTLSSPTVTPPSPSTSGCDESDPEWIPSDNATPATKNKRSKPYARPSQSGSGTHHRSRGRSGVCVEEKRIRKKEQNKNAATRYRMKKKAEVEEIVGEEKTLEDTNSELKQKVSDLSREIKYLKGLMRDLFKAKGLLKSD